MVGESNSLSGWNTWGGRCRNTCQTSVYKVKNPFDHIPLALVHTIDIDKIEFGYFSRSAAEHQDHLQPVYVFFGTARATLPDGEEVNLPLAQGMAERFMNGLSGG